MWRPENDGVENGEGEDGDNDVEERVEPQTVNRDVKMRLAVGK